MSKKEEKQLQETLEHMEDRDELAQQEELVRKNKLGTMPIGRLLVSMSLPIVISMLVQALYNVVDSIFVARLGEGALAAVGLVFPIQNLMIGVAVGTGVGINALLGRRLGEQNVEGANRVATNGVFLAIVSWIGFVLLGLFASEPFLAAFASGPDMTPEMLGMGVDYMRIVTIGSLGLFMSITLERLLQATGRTMFSMASQMVGAVVNIVLDPIMIFGYFGFPAMGVSGAALATIIGQYFSMGLAIWCNVVKNHEIQLKIRGFRPSGNTIVSIYKVGLPSIIMQSIGSVMTFCMNAILTGFGTTAVSVFSVYFKLQSFVFMPVFGCNNGMVPIIAFNYGARQKKRIQKTIRLCLLVCFGIMTLGTLLFWLIPQQMLALFDAQENMVAMGTAALRIISLGFPIAAVSIVFTGVFQALGQGVYSLIMSVVRQIVFLIPIAWLFAQWWGLPALWAAFPIAEFMCLLCAVFFFRRAWNKILKPL